jgi:hypothetical protein
MPGLHWLSIVQVSRIALILLLTFVALSAINYLSLQFAPCIEPKIVRDSDNPKKYADKEDSCQEAHGIISAGLYQILGWSPESWTAAGTIMLALCTLVLASATRRQVQLAREDFIATNRPLLRVRRFQHSRGSAADDGRISVTFTIANVGNSDAVLIESRGGIALVPPSVVPMPVYDGLPPVIEPRVFAPGTSDNGFILDRPDKQRGVMLRAYGFLSYSDRIGNIRTTAFCRQFNSGKHRFEIVDDPDSEYEN